MKTKENPIKKKKDIVAPNNLSFSDKNKRKVSDSFFQRIISLLKKEELI